MGGNLVIKFGKMVDTHGVVENKFLVIKNGIIHGITDSNPVAENEIDASQLILLPGFVDIHTHGYFGVDSMNSGVSDILEWSRKLTAHGVTSFIPTAVSESHENIIKFLNKIRGIMQMENTGARVLGARLEGPYISPYKRGAHNPEYVRDINMEEIRELADKYNDVLRIIDMAPELGLFQDAFNLLQGRGIIVSAGHSNADYEEARKALAGGVSLITHFYNAMTPLNHRNPGMIGAGFLSNNTTLELIGDLHHVSKPAIEIMVNLKHMDNIAVITDSISIGGTEIKNGQLGGLNIVLRDGVAWIEGTETIAGSILTMDKALKNLMDMGIPLEKAVLSMGYVQSKLLGLMDAGNILPGYKADLCVVDDEYNVKYTIINGNLVYSS